MAANRFKEGVAQTAGLEHALRPGLQAIIARDRSRIRCDNTRHLAGSVNVDAALKKSQPNAPRWDYGIGLRASNDQDCVVWMEIHPATTRKNFKELVAKLQWLQSWLAQINSPLQKLTPRFVWVATGRASINLASNNRRYLNSLGLRLEGSILHLDKLLRS
jgi:hypothetical protein